MEVDLFSVLAVLVGIFNVWGMFIVKGLLRRLNKIEESHDSEVKRLDKERRESVDKLRDRIEANQKEIYRHHDHEAEKIRKDLGELGTSLRAEISATNGLILELIKEIRSSSS